MNLVKVLIRREFELDFTPRNDRATTLIAARNEANHSTLSKLQTTATVKDSTFTLCPPLSLTHEIARETKGRGRARRRHEDSTWLGYKILLCTRLHRSDHFVSFSTTEKMKRTEIAASLLGQQLTRKRGRVMGSITNNTSLKAAGYIHQT